MNKLTIIGNLTRDPEVHTTSEGKNVSNFTVAVNRRKKIENQPDADFFRISAWGKLGELCAKYLAKGRKVCVSGPVSVSTDTAQDGSTRASMEVYAEDVEFLNSAGGNGAPASEGEPSVPAGGFTAVETDSLPF